MRKYIRTAGLLYLMIIVLGIFGEVVVRGKVTTAAELAQHASLWRWGIAGDLLMHVCDIPLMWIFYLLFRRVNNELALLALLFNLIQTGVLVANKLSLVMALLVVGEEPRLAQHYMQLHGLGFSAGLIFFGFACLVYGYLIRKSGFLPKTIGWLMQLAGVCYLVSSFSGVISPVFASCLEPYILLPPFIAELSLALWLLFKKVSTTD